MVYVGKYLELRDVGNSVHVFFFRVHTGAFVVGIVSLVQSVRYLCMTQSRIA